MGRDGACKGHVASLVPTEALSGSCLCRWLLSSSKGRGSVAVLATEPPITPSLVRRFLVPRRSPPGCRSTGPAAAAC